MIVEIAEEFDPSEISPHVFLSEPDSELVESLMHQLKNNEHV